MKFHPIALVALAVSQFFVVSPLEAGMRSRGRGGRHCECFTLPSGDKAKPSKTAGKAKSGAKLAAGDAPPAPIADAPKIGEAKAVAPALPKGPHDLPGFLTVMDKKGRMWIFRSDSPEFAEFQTAGDLGKHVVRVGEGPDGVTIKAADAETLDAYQALWAAASPEAPAPPIK